MADKEYIERGEAILAVTRDGCTANVVGVLFHMPAADVVSRGVYEQVQWERDMAMQQLEEHGIPFGGTADNVVEVVRCKNCTACDHCYPAKALGEEAAVGWYCKLRKTYVKPYDFCSYGERKEQT